MQVTRQYKLPEEVKDYGVDYTQWFSTLPGDFILSMDAAITQIEMEAPSLNPAVITDIEFSPYVATAWVKNGLPGEFYQITFTITTNQGRVDVSVMPLDIITVGV